MQRNAEFLVEYIKETTGLEVCVSEKASKGAAVINLAIDEEIEKGYSLRVKEKRITIAGHAASDVFWGIQTLRKSLPVLTEADSVLLPPVEITDAPRFTYRGMHLDCARHFFTVEFLKQYIDLLALHNMNVFHWHLTDDQGWRLEIKRYPNLTRIGSVRTGTVIGNNSDMDDHVPYGGFYTQEQAREIVAYARERYIEVIPEIDVPGHTMAVLASYPELACREGAYAVGHKWGVYNDVLCVGNPQTYEFVKGVLDEVMEIFPSEEIHIGGDETPTVRWEQCPKCNALPLDGTSYQGYFTKQITDYLESRGRRAICWDESLEQGASRRNVIMSWRGTKPGIYAAKMGHDVIMTPLTHCYFDYYQTEKNSYEPSITGMWPVTVEKVYSLDLVPDSLSVEVKQRIKGVQANLWTEQISSPYVVEYMALPRICALAEVAWTAAEKKDFAAFKERVTRLSRLYDLYGWTYAKHLWPERMTKERWKID